MLVSHLDRQFETWVRVFTVITMLLFVSFVSFLYGERESAFLFEGDAVDVVVVVCEVHVQVVA